MHFDFYQIMMIIKRNNKTHRVCVYYERAHDFSAYYVGRDFAFLVMNTWAVDVSAKGIWLVRFKYGAKSQPITNLALALFFVYYIYIAIFSHCIIAHKRQPCCFHDRKEMSIVVCTIANMPLVVEWVNEWMTSLDGRLRRQNSNVSRSVRKSRLLFFFWSLFWFCWNSTSFLWACILRVASVLF